MSEDTPTPDPAVTSLTAKAGDKVKVGVVRDGKDMEMVVTLRARDVDRR